MIWLQSALDELTRIWTGADSPRRQAITQAAHAIDQELQRSPQDKGESREEGERVLFVLPLGILFQVDEQRSEVYVLHVWHIQRRE